MNQKADVDWQDRNDKLRTLANSFLKAKEDEETAKAARISVEEEIAALIETPEQGQTTVSIPIRFEKALKITVKRGLIYKADARDIREVFLDAFIAERLPIPIVTKIEEKLDVKGYEWYKENHPEIFSELSEFVTVTPKKTAVTVKVSA